VSQGFRKRPPLGVARREERLSEYFDFARWPEKASYKVTRAELLAMLTRQHRVVIESRWYRRLWRWLVSRRGSASNVVPSPPPQ